MIRVQESQKYKAISRGYKGYKGVQVQGVQGVQGVHNPSMNIDRLIWLFKPRQDEKRFCPETSAACRPIQELYITKTLTQKDL